MADDTENHSHVGDESGSGVKDARVAHIVDLKLRLRYTHGTAKRLADEWGVSPEYVRHLSCEANKAVRRQVTDPDAMAAELVPELQRSFRAMARFLRDPRLDPHAKAKMASSLPGMGNLLADIAGLKAAKKTELSGPDGGPVAIQTGLLILPAEELE